MERGRSPLDGSVSVLNRPRSPRRRSRSGGMLRIADPSRVDRGRPGGGPGKPSMESGVGLAPKEVRALSFALFPDAEPQCRTGTHPVPPIASGRKDGFRGLPKRSRRGRQFNRHGCEKPFQFTVTTHAPLHSTKLPLGVWLKATWLMQQSDKGLSSIRLAETLGVSQPDGRADGTCSASDGGAGAHTRGHSRG